MLKHKYGRIINISSVNGRKGQFGQTNYSASKAGIIGFSRSLAIELAETGITVNTVCPGYVGTSMVEAIPQNILESIISKIPVGRLAKPSEIADTVSFLSAKTSAKQNRSQVSLVNALSIHDQRPIYTLNKTGMFQRRYRVKTETRINH